MHGTETGSQPTSSVGEVHILWLTAGLSCDGDTVAITAATQPSIEDIVLGAIPGIPKVQFHNPVLAYQNGEEFLEFFHEAAAGNLDPFVLVVEGSIPNENNKDAGFWAAMGTDKHTGQPIPTCTWIDRLAPKAWAVVGAGTCATYGGIHAMEGNPHRMHGTSGLPWLGLEIARRHLRRVCARLPGAPRQLYGNAAVPASAGCRNGTDDPSRRATATGVVVRTNRP